MNCTFRAGNPVKLTMISEDVIHDLFVPAFRVKKDVLPGRYTMVWFEATQTGSYHLFCSQYCGTQHSKMGGWVHVMEPADYAKWIDGPGASEPLAVAGRTIVSKTWLRRLPSSPGERARTVVGGSFWSSRETLFWRYHRGQ